MKQINRRELARVLLDYTKKHARGSTTSIAAYLIAEKREREITAVLREMERLNETGGEVIAYIKTARPLSNQTRQYIIELVRAHSGSSKKVTLSEEIQPELTGGIIVEFAGNSVDLSVRGKLESLVSHNRKNPEL